LSVVVAESISIVQQEEEEEEEEECVNNITP